MNVNEYDEQHVIAKKVTCLRETAKALYCQQDDDSYWIPKSQVSDDSDVSEKGDSGNLVFTKWLARENEWYDED